MKIGLIREGKVPLDKRVALIPSQCAEIMDRLPYIEIIAESSPFRCYKDKEYEEAGVKIVDDASEADILLGIKEVPISDLVPRKTYFFFSHTIKKQAYNRNLLIEILDKKIRMIDYETLVRKGGQRVIAFGRYAGLVGAYNGLLTYGKRFNLYDLKPAHECFDMQEMFEELSKVKLPAIKIVLTGGGRVSKGAIETLEKANIRKVDHTEFLTNDYDEAVYTQIDSSVYNKKKDGSDYIQSEFFANPELYEGAFLPFSKVSDILIAGAYWDPNAPVLFTREDIKDESFKIKVIADITCDIEGSIPTTKRASTIEDPIYDYNINLENTEPALSSPKNITVMAVDNLPNELPRDASESFGRQLIDNVLPNLLFEDSEDMIKNATITLDGKLTSRYNYLQDFVEGND